VPTYFVISRALATTRAKVLALGVVCVPLTEYQPLLAALVLYLCYLQYLSSGQPVFAQRTPALALALRESPKDVTERDHVRC
jgi:hypothetical protein